MESSPSTNDHISICNSGENEEGEDIIGREESRVKASV